MYKASEIAEIIGSDAKYLVDPDATIRYLEMDTRKIVQPKETLFFALSGRMHDGHDFIKDAIASGIRNFVVSKVYLTDRQDLNFYIVDNTLIALQNLAAYHRRQFDFPILGITGSNGKTTIKEWLYQLINDRQVVKSPKSYNSQTGVPLSVWQIKEGDQLGFFEAGISRPHEMDALQKIIRPDIGLFTTLGDAHNEGFEDQATKLAEKLILFKDAKTIIFNADNIEVSIVIKHKFGDRNLLSWGKSADATLFQILDIITTSHDSRIDILFQEKLNTIHIPFTDVASIENALHCVAVLLLLGYNFESIETGMKRLQNIPMRLEMKNGIQGSILINDTYNADLQSFKIAIEFLSQQAGQREKMVILSDFMQTGLTPEQLNLQLANQIHNHQIQEVIAVGKGVAEISKFLGDKVQFQAYENTDQLLKAISTIDVYQKAILVKGARSFQLEKVIHALSDKGHTATLETDLQAVEHNLGVFSKHLKSETQIIVVIKASAYGSGSEELAKFLEFKKVPYLAVAFIDEGIQLRKSGIQIPIIILNPDRNGVLEMTKYNLEPEVYCLEQLEDITTFLSRETSSTLNIHIKMDTGMHRLGFSEDEILPMIQILSEYRSQLKVKSIFSHLSSSEDPDDDDFTHRQVVRLNEAYDRIAQGIGYKPMKHILNSAGIIRFPQYHFDMVRLGLGLYGIDSTGQFADKLEKVHTLKASVVQIKNVVKSEEIGYNRRGKLNEDSKIAVINMGYADGLMRIAGNGKFCVNIQGREYPLIGNVCMDLSLVNIGNNTSIKIGDEVEIFGKSKPIEILASVCQTIPYEILCRISTRIKRLYTQG